jgi:hypothetical protein
MRTLKSFIFGIFVVAFSLYSCSPENAPVSVSPTLEITSTPSDYDHTFTTIDLKGKVVVPQGGEQITERGLCWSTSPNPTVNDNKKTAGQNTFDLKMDNLIANTPYYFRAYAITSSGVTYSSEATFTTSTLDDTLWDFYIKLDDPSYPQPSEWHADVLFKADGTTVYDEPDYPGLYTEYGEWSLSGNTVTYLMIGGTNGDNYLFTGTLVENTMSGTFSWADPSVTTYFDATMYP